MFNEENYENPFMTVNWRWSRILSLLQEDNRPSKAEDKYIWRGYKFLRELRSSKNDSERYTISIKHRTIADAFAWYRKLGKRRYYMEALLLCNDIDIVGIADYFDVSPDVVLTYSKLYFDVTEHRSKPGFLCANVIQPAIREELRNLAEPEVAWKLMAIFGGFNIVKSCWECTAQDRSVLEFYKNVGISQIMKNFAIGNCLRPVNTYSVSEITGEVIKLVEIETKASNMSDSQRQRAESISDMLSGNMFQMLEAAESANNSPRELRLHEKLMLPQEATNGTA